MQNYLHLHLLNKFISFTENSLEDMKREREEKKRYLLRKLSFRPTIEELKSRKVCNLIISSMLSKDSGNS